MTLEEYYEDIGKYINKPLDESKLSNIDKNILESWYNKNRYEQLIDLWDEVDNTVRLYEKYKTTKIEQDKLYFMEQLKCVTRDCLIICSDPKISNGFKFELKIAEYELYDYMLYDNLFNNTSESVMYWFDQWYKDINYDLIYD